MPRDRDRDRERERQRQRSRHILTTISLIWNSFSSRDQELAVTAPSPTNIMTLFGDVASF